MAVLILLSVYTLILLSGLSSNVLVKRWIKSFIKYIFRLHFFLVGTFNIFSIIYQFFFSPGVWDKQTIIYLKPFIYGTPNFNEIKLVFLNKLKIIIADPRNAHNEFIMII